MRTTLASLGEYNIKDMGLEVKTKNHRPKKKKQKTKQGNAKGPKAKVKQKGQEKPLESYQAQGNKLRGSISNNARGKTTKRHLYAPQTS